MTRGPTPDRLETGRALGVANAARAMACTEWWRVPLPLPRDPAERRQLLAGYAAGIEDGLTT